MPYPPLEALSLHEKDHAEAKYFYSMSSQQRSSQIDSNNQLNHHQAWQPQRNLLQPFSCHLVVSYWPIYAITKAMKYIIIDQLVVVFIWRQGTKQLQDLLNLSDGIAETSHNHKLWSSLHQMEYGAKPNLHSPGPYKVVWHRFPSRSTEQGPTHKGRASFRIQVRQLSMD